MSEVTLTHPDGHGPITVPERRARILVRQGWQEADGATPEVASDEVSPETASLLADPEATPDAELLAFAELHGIEAPDAGTSDPAFREALRLAIATPPDTSPED